MKTFPLFSLLGINIAMFFMASTAFASEGAGLPWGNFALRVLNLVLFLGIIWYFAGKMIKNTLDGKARKVVDDMDHLDTLKKDAAAQLAEMKIRVANVEEECTKLLSEGKSHAQQVAAAIVLDAENQAKEILRQAERTAQQSIKAEVDAIRAQLAEEVVLEVRNRMTKDIDKNTQEKLVDISISQVSGF